MHGEFHINFVRFKMVIYTYVDLNVNSFELVAVTLPVTYAVADRLLY